MIFNSEEDLIIAMKKHDQDALKEVIDQYGKLILYIIHKSLSTPIEKQYVMIVITMYLLSFGLISINLIQKRET